MRISVALDGPAGAGKSTIAKILADKLNLMYINTGAMYRAVTLRALEKSLSSEDIEALCSELDSMEIHFDKERIIVDGIDLSEAVTMPEISRNVSRYAAIKEVRQRLVKSQRNMAREFDVIMDGRDIGTVVLKDADFKFFLTASPEERAKRRYEELVKRGLSVNYDAILEEIIKRDYEDTHRESDPLQKAEDAVEIDTTGLSIEQVVEIIYDHISGVLKNRDLCCK